MKLGRLRTSWMRAGFVVCTLLAIGVLAISEFNHWRGREDVNELAQRLNAQRQLQTFLTVLVDAETGQRGFLLTGDTHYLGPYRRAADTLRQMTDELRDRYRRDPDALGLLSTVVNATTSKLTELDLTIRLHHNGQASSATNVLATDFGRQQMDAVRDGVAKLIEYEDRKRHAVAAQWERMRSASRYGIALTSLLVVLAYFLVMRQSAQIAQEREAQQRALQAERDALDDKVDKRTEDLVRLASHLQSSREDERAKLARELHDELGAVLTAAKLDVAWLGAKLKGQDPALVNKLQALKSVLEDAIELKRRIIEDLRPSLLTNLGLVPALERLLDEQRARFGGTLSASIDPEVDVPEDIALVLYRVVQEALTNVHKYADASHVEVSLRRLPQHLELRISDDGTGFDVSAVGATHHGVAGMRHRLLSIRAALNVDSAPGRGTVITAMVPLAEIEAAQQRAAASQAAADAAHLSPSSQPLLPAHTSSALSRSDEPAAETA